MSALLAMIGLAAAGSPTLQQPTTPQPPPQKTVDYRNPPRRYVTEHVQGWTVLVEESLAREAPDVEKQALARLGVVLRRAMAALPHASHDELKKLTLMLMYGPEAKEGGRDNGLEFFRSDAPQHYPTLDPRMSNAVVIYSARNWLFLSDLWALKALVHEFSHAHHLLRWPETQPEIYNAWASAMQRGLYRNVKDNEGHTLDKAWATTNQLEYFAELSCMYFVECNYYPFNREQLRTYDPAGCAMIRKMWGIAGH